MILSPAEDAPKWVSVPRETGEPKGVTKGLKEIVKSFDEVNVTPAPTRLSG